MKKLAKVSVLFVLVLMLGTVLFGCGSKYNGDYVCTLDEGGELTLTLDGKEWSVEGDKRSEYFDLLSNGQFEIKSGKITLKWKSPMGSYVPMIYGTVDGDAITLDFGEVSLVFTKSGS